MPPAPPAPDAPRDDRPVADAPVVVFDHVSLAFDDKVILEDVSFTLRKGHTMVVLGASGAGKSTILRL
ncbi:MAG: ATP-binding cassette domain-containing protein, partial [Acidobacteria bacterium]|nr:ATP-binding cassette domain-containing protein [Acidobacteriota bacterium]